MRVLKGAEEMAFAKGFHLIYSSVPYNEDGKLLEAKLSSILGRGDLRAVLLGGKLDFDIIRKVDSATGRDVPTIVMGRASEGFCGGVSHITDSNGLAMRTALRHLFDNGHKKIAFVNESLHWAWNREIRDDFFQFMKFNGLPIINGAIADDLPGDGPEDAHKAVCKMIPILKKESVTAIACGTDRMAQGAIKALKERGIDVPGEISVTGCGNLELGKYLDPQLTTVDQCQEEKGREGIQAAIGEYPEGSVIRVPVNLIERNSVTKIKKH
jgi:DNA-binding LacI/PurR family transcriptional regulator